MCAVEEHHEIFTPRCVSRDFGRGHHVGECEIRLDVKVSKRRCVSYRT